MFTPKNQQAETVLSNGKTSIIGEGIIITGEIKTDADIRIDGNLNGNIISAAKVVIGTGGVIQGNITAQQCDITGTVHGNLMIKDLLNLRDKAEIKGDITAGKLSMEPTVSFNGKCIMNASSLQIVEMNMEANERKTAAE